MAVPMMGFELNWFELYVLAVAFRWPLAFAVAAAAVLLSFGFSNNLVYRWLSIVVSIVCVGPLLLVCVVQPSFCPV